MVDPPGATRATIKVPNDNAGADTQTLACVAGPGHEIEAQTLIGAPEPTAGAKIHLYLPRFFILAGVVRVFLQLLSLTNMSPCCCSVSLLFQCICVLGSLLYLSMSSTVLL